MLQLDDVFSHDGRTLTVIHSCTLAEHARHITAQDDTGMVTFIESHDHLTTPKRPFMWHEPGAPHPLAGELMPGDMLPGPPDYPDLPQRVTRVMENFDGELRITTVDHTIRKQVRQWLFRPDELVDFNRERVRRRKSSAPIDEVTPDGPYVSSNGAIYVYLRRPSRGGRPPARQWRATFDELPLKDPDTGEIIPYFTPPPPRDMYPQPQLASPAAFTETALKHPLVVQLCRRKRHGLPPHVKTLEELT